MTSVIVTTPWTFQIENRYNPPVECIMIHTVFECDHKYKPYAMRFSGGRRRNARLGEMGDPRENPSTSGIVRHDSLRLRLSWVTRSAGNLSAQPPRLHFRTGSLWGVRGVRNRRHWPAFPGRSYLLECRRLQPQPRCVLVQTGADVGRPAVLTKLSPVGEFLLVAPRRQLRRVCRRDFVSVARVGNTDARLLAGLAGGSPPIKANRVQSPAGSLPEFRKPESCRRYRCLAGFSRGSPVSPALSFRRCSILTLFHPHGDLKTSLLRAAQISLLKAGPQTKSLWGQGSWLLGDVLRSPDRTTAIGSCVRGRFLPQIALRRNAACIRETGAAAPASFLRSRALRTYYRVPDSVETFCEVRHSGRYTGLHGTRGGIFRLPLPDFITGLVIGPVLFSAACSIPALVPGLSHCSFRALGHYFGQKLSFPNASTWDTAAWDSAMTSERHVHQSAHPCPKTRLVLLVGNTEHFLARRIVGQWIVVSRFQLTDEKIDGRLTDGRPTDGCEPSFIVNPAVLSASVVQPVAARTVGTECMLVTHSPNQRGAALTPRLLYFTAQGSRATLVNSCRTMVLDEGHPLQPSLARAALLEGWAEIPSEQITLLAYCQLNPRKTVGSSHFGGGGGAAVAERLARSPPTKANRVQSPAGYSRIFASGDSAGRCRWSANFLGDLPFPPPFHFGTAPYSLLSPSSALKTSLLRTWTMLAQSSPSTVTADNQCAKPRIDYSLKTRRGAWLSETPHRGSWPDFLRHLVGRDSPVTAARRSFRSQLSSWLVTWRKCPHPDSYLRTYVLLRRRNITLVVTTVLKEPPRSPHPSPAHSLGPSLETEPRSPLVKRAGELLVSRRGRVLGTPFSPAINPYGTVQRTFPGGSSPPPPPLIDSAQFLLCLRPSSGIHRGSFVPLPAQTKRHGSSFDAGVPVLWLAGARCLVTVFESYWLLRAAESSLGHGDAQIAQDKFWQKGPQWRSVFLMLRCNWGGGCRSTPVVRLLDSHQGEFSHVGIVLDDAAGGRVFSVISHFPRSFILALLHTRLLSSSWAFKSSMLRALPNLFTHFRYTGHLQRNVFLPSRRRVN
ncbi:hypothetical protein PR048_032512 [Dryococelus australis]|uniref:Uncharacterized protein n=1 Tax=Dryococelus australis TaxID=614101 RepID=A0ABQ9G598_9NEOP|nr:hypothetical protein PR048_032512 [Dryococelus australis]